MAKRSAHQLQICRARFTPCNRVVPWAKKLCFALICLSKAPAYECVTEKYPWGYPRDGLTSHPKGNSRYRNWDNSGHDGLTASMRTWDRAVQSGRRKTSCCINNKDHTRTENRAKKKKNSGTRLTQTRQEETRQKAKTIWRNKPNY